MKVACEQLVTAGTASSMLVRPGLIVGPDDGSGRFSYWPDRLARGGRVLAPGSPTDVVQVIDVRDLAAWILDAAEARTTGVFDGVGEPMPLAQLLDEVAAGVGADAAFTWVDSDFLDRAGRGALGGRGLGPALAAAAGVRRHDVALPRPAIAAGLVSTCRRDGPRHPRRDGDRDRRGARGRGARRLARPLGCAHGQDLRRHLRCVGDRCGYDNARLGNGGQRVLTIDLCR